MLDPAGNAGGLAAGPLPEALEFLESLPAKIMLDPDVTSGPKMISGRKP